MADVTCEIDAVVLHGYLGKFHIVQVFSFLFFSNFPCILSLLLFILFWFPPSACVCLFESGGKFEVFVTCLLMMFAVLIYMMTRLPSWCDPIS